MSISKKSVAFVLVFALALGVVGFGPQNAQAASLTNLSDTLSSQKVDEASSHIIKFRTPTGANQSSDDIIITFPSDFNFTSKTIGTVTFTHGSSTGAEITETLAASPSADNWGAVFSGTESRILTLTAPSDGVGAGAIATNDYVIVTYNSTNSLNPGTPGTYSIAISGSFGDTGSMSVQILSEDQVSIAATVNQTLTFSISDTAIGFATLSSSNARYATADATGSNSEADAHNIIVGTNAAFGYSVTVTGPTLTSGANTIDAIGASATGTAAGTSGTEQFGLKIRSVTGGTGDSVAPYDDTGYAYNGVASPDEVASAAGSSSNTTYQVGYIANIPSDMAAGSYTTALTYAATPSF